MREERLYKVSIKGRSVNKVTGVSYDAYGIAVPFPEFFGKFAKVEKTGEREMKVTILTDDEVDAYERKRHAEKLRKQRERQLKIMYDRGLISEIELQKFIDAKKEGN